MSRLFGVGGSDVSYSIEPFLHPQPTMTIFDRITLSRLASKYDIRELETVLDAAPLLTDEELQALAGILRRLPDPMLRRGVRHEAFRRLVESLIERAAVPPRTAQAFLKAGIPISGVVLPALARARLAGTVGIAQGKLLLDGVPVGLAGLAIDQVLALRRAGVHPS